MEMIKITGFFCPFRTLHPNSALVVNKPVKQHLCTIMKMVKKDRIDGHISCISLLELFVELAL